MNIRNQIIALGNQLAEEQNCAYQLWTWLPSYGDAVNRYGDYASNHTPSVQDILQEAAVYFAYLNRTGVVTAVETHSPDGLKNLTPDEQEFFFITAE